jgi:hypothetical protein
MGSKKRKGSTAMKAVIHQAHEECLDVDVDGSIAGGARVVDAATIEGANAAGNSMIEVNVANTTNAAAAGNSVAATAAAAGDAIAATAAATGNAIAANAAITGDTANNGRTADAATIEGANATGNSTIEVDIANTADVAATGDSVTATAAAAGDGVKVTTDMITTEIAEAAMHVIIGKTSAKDTDVSSLVRLSIHICRALLYVQSLLLSHYKIILFLNNFTHISLQNLVPSQECHLPEE